MLSDIVVDTNVMMHAQNPMERRFKSSLTFLNALLKSATQICVDVGFDINPISNQSLIAGEYFKHLRFGSASYAVLTNLARANRIKELNKNLPDRERKVINQCVRKSRDKTFVVITRNSEEKILVSHDFKDFQNEKRAHLRRELGIAILEASECHSKL